MSQFPMGKATVDIVADATDANQKIDQTTKKVEEFKQKSEEGGEGFANGIKKSIGAVTSFVGSLTAAIGVMTLFLNIGKKIGDTLVESFQSAADKVKELTAGVLEVDSTKRYDALQRLLDQKMKELDERRDHEASFWYGFWQNLAQETIGMSLSRVQAIQDELAELQKSMKDERESVVGGRIREEEERRKKAAAAEAADKEKAAKAEEDAAVARARAEADEALRGREILEAEYEAMYEKIREAAELEAKLAEKAHKEEMDRIQEQIDARMEGIRRVHEEMQRIMREQEAGFGIGNITFGNGGAGSIAALHQRSRTGRGNGRG